MPGRLRRQGLTKEYLQHLQVSSTWLLGLVRELGGKISSSSAARDVDRWLELAVEVAYERGFKMYQVRLGVIGLQRKLRVPGPLLRETWQAIRGWKTLQPTRSRVPISRYALEGLLLTCLLKGKQSFGWLRRTWWATMLSSWLSFYGMLRPGEALRLQVRDLVFPDCIALGEPGLGLVVLIRSPKTRRIWASQSVLVKEAGLVRWLRWWVADLKPRDAVFTLSRRLWSDRMSESAELLHLQSCRFTPSSFRAGGATHYYRAEQNIGKLQFMGRWKSTDSLHHYIQDAMAVLVTSQAPAAGRECLEMAQNFIHYLNHAPILSAQTLLKLP